MLDIRKEVSELQSMYSERESRRLLSALILGGSGSGKTRFSCTGRRPIHIDSFDPDGTKTVSNWIKEGWVIADTRFEDSGFPLWDQVFEERLKSGYFNHIGTYVLDSFTTFSDAVMATVLSGLVRKADRGGTTKASKINTELLRIPQENDYPLQMNILMNALNSENGILRLPCDVIVIGHLEDKKNKQGAVIARGLYCTGKLMTRIPRLFQEIYVCETEETSKGINWIVKTQPEGLGEARTRMGSEGKLSFKESPDLMAIMRKCGLDPQHKSMPCLEKDAQA